MLCYRIDWINPDTRKIEMATIHTFESGAIGEIEHRAKLREQGRSKLIQQKAQYQYDVANHTLLMLLDASDYDSLIVGIGQLGIE